MTAQFSASPCQVQAYVLQSEALAVLTGSLRMHESERVKQMLLSIMSPPVETMNVDLGSLTEIDSAGLGVIVGLHMTSRKNKQTLRILAPTSHQMYLFETTRLNKLLTIVGGGAAHQIRLGLEQPQLAVDLSRWTAL